MLSNTCLKRQTAKVNQYHEITGDKLSTRGRTLLTLKGTNVPLNVKPSVITASIFASRPIWKRAVPVAEGDAHLIDASTRLKPVFDSLTGMLADFSVSGVGLAVARIVTTA